MSAVAWGFSLTVSVSVVGLIHNLQVTHLRNCVCVCACFAPGLQARHKNTLHSLKPDLLGFCYQYSSTLYLLLHSSPLYAHCLWPWSALSSTHILFHQTFVLFKSEAVFSSPIFLKPFPYLNCEAYECLPSTWSRFEFMLLLFSFCHS